MPSSPSFAVDWFELDVYVQRVQKMDYLNFSANWMVTKRYNDIATELPAVLNVLQLFDGYMRVPQIAHLTQRVHKLKEKLSVQVSADLQAAFQVNDFDCFK